MNEAGLNLKNLGAADDGSTDDTATIQLTFAIAGGCGGDGGVFFPPGALVVATLIDLRSNASLVGRRPLSRNKCTGRD